MARPQIQIDPILVEQLAEFGCSNAEIAAAANCSTDTLERRFAAEMDKGREQSKTKLRKLQWRAAEAGNVAMLIWLGKQILGQRDKADLDVASEQGIAVSLSNEQLVELAKAARGGGDTR